VLAKGKTVKVVVDGGDLAKPIEISDPNTLVHFQVWAGPGTSSNQGQAFIADWSSGAVKELPKGLTRYEVSFYVSEPEERIAYVVLYSFDASTGRGYVYIPGKSDPHFQSNVRSIFRGVEGDWFHAWTLWDNVAGPLITNARPTAFEKNPPEPKWMEDDRRKLLAKAQEGDAGSQMWLAAGYEQGWFGERNFSEALKWFKQSATQGNPDAENSLGQMYEDGEGVEQNYALAAEWYRKAAEHVPDLGGAGQGRNNLGLLYLDGRGVPRDYVQAYMWFRLSLGGTAKCGPHMSNLSSVAQLMTSAEIEDAEHKVEEWKIRHHDQQN
jgi:tetratricopeptide (TPR) repeat protein